MAKNYYAVLGVSKDANLEKIKKAYRTVAKKYHPDAGGSSKDSEKFMEAKEAYETLADEASRKKYDRELERQASGLRIKSMPRVVRKRPPFFDDVDSLFSLMDDFFSGFMPGFFERRERSGKDLHVEVILSPAEAARGGLVTMTIPIIEPYPQCGTGTMWSDLLCPACHGYRKVRVEKQFSLRVPPHVQHGTEIRVSLGDIGLKNTYLTATILIDPTIDRENL